MESKRSYQTLRPGEKITHEEHQMIMLDIMRDFHDFCEKNELEYFLDAGTLLGAVRHKGFIPWDNDMDVCMMRPDYDRFLNIVKENGNYINDHLIVEMPEDTIYCFLKIGDTRTKLIEFPDTYPEECYIYIDIFPKDGIDSLTFKNKVLCKRSEFLGLMHWFNKHSIPYWTTKKRGIKKLIASIAKVFVKDKNRPYRIQQRMIQKHNKKYPLESCEYVTTLVNGEYYRICPKACFDNRIILDFEGERFYAPAGYDEWLRILYGDNYMELPPEEKREVHNITAEWR